MALALEGDPVLRIKSLSVAYRRGIEWRDAVVDLSFDIARGEAFGLVGESGSGKSTVGLSVLQYLPKAARMNASSLVFDGRDLRTLSASELRVMRGNQISAVYQHAGAALNPSLTVGRQLTEGLIEHKGASFAEGMRSAGEVLDRLRIQRVSQTLTLYPHELSGGMQQRVVLATAILNDPSLIVLDEPTTALDATVQSEIVDILNELRRERQTSFLLISHDIDLVRQLCDRVGVMQSGRMVEEGMAADVCQRPRHFYTKELISSLPKTNFTKHDGRLGELVPSAGRLTVLSTAKPGQNAKEPSALRCVGISHAFGGQPVLNNVNLDIAQGETFGLIGESGSGKSTLAKIITGLQSPRAGNVEIFGTTAEARVEERSRSHRSSIQMVFQSPDMTLNPRHRINKVLRGPMRRLALMVWRKIPARIEFLLESVRLPSDIGRSFAWALSGGQRQRVAIARAFAAEPKIIVLDEPTSALDVSVQATVLNLLNDLQSRNGAAYLFISHDLKVVRYMADRIGVLYRGQLVEVGSADRIFEGPNHPYTRSLLSSVPAPLQHDQASIVSGAGCAYADRCPISMPICCDKPPPEQSDGPDHLIRCWHETIELKHRKLVVSSPGRRQKDDLADVIQHM